MPVTSSIWIQPPDYATVLPNFPNASQSVHTSAPSTILPPPQRIPLVASTTSLEQAFVSIQDFIDIHGHQLEDIVITDWLRSVKITQLLFVSNLFLESGQFLPANKNYGLALSEMCTLLEKTASFYLVILALANYRSSSAKIIQQAMLGFLSNSDRGKPKPSLLGAISRALVEHSTTGIDVRLGLFQCLVDLISARLGNLSSWHVLIRVYFVRFLHNIPWHIQANQINAQLAREMNLWLPQWPVSQRVMLFAVAYLLHNIGDLGPAKRCYDVAMSVLPMLDPSLQHLMAGDVLGASVCNYDLQYYELARQQAQMVFLMLDNAHTVNNERTLHMAEDLIQKINSKIT